MGSLLLFKPILKILQDKNIIDKKIMSGSIKDNRSSFYSISYNSMNSKGIAVFNVIILDSKHYISLIELRIQSRIFKFSLSEILKLYKTELKK
ncbi:MAG: hypothetical protein CR988_07835 [Treponema sp.]|nr:MAG: hypothetical protein CR988_07835 [Treponema sp.]